VSRIGKLAELGITVDRIREECVDGIPLFAAGKGVSDDIIQRAIFSAEDRVERDLDILIRVRRVYCIQNQMFDPPDQDAVILPPLDKPSNWFAGHRRGAIRLPRNNVKQIEKITLKPFGMFSREIDIPIRDNRVRLERNTVRFVPGPYAQEAYLAGWMMQDGINVPGGIEIIFTAGLTKREIEQDWYPVLSMVTIGAQMEIYTGLQPRIGAGLQEERLVQDALSNDIKYADKRDGGALGGELKRLELQYNRYRDTLRAGKLSFVYIQ
jgi:hypothetical protein